jgi:hypothetical protein
MCACHVPKQEGVQSAVTAIPQHSSVGANSLTRGPTRRVTGYNPRVGIPAVGWVGGPTRVGSDPLVTTLARGDDACGWCTGATGLPTRRARLAAAPHSRRLARWPATRTVAASLRLAFALRLLALLLRPHSPHTRTERGGHPCGHPCDKATASFTTQLHAWSNDVGERETPRTLLCAFAACSRSSSSISADALRSACSDACCVRSMVAAAFCVRAARSSCLNSCAA